jgi:predicted transcriptional regulator of viral defense system
MASTRLKIAKADIIGLFENRGIRVFKRSEIDEILLENRKFWRLSESTTVHSFIAFMLDNTKLQQVNFQFPVRKEIRYVWGKVSVYELVLSLKPDSYFTHFTAMHLHQLTDQIPKTLYLNYEQPLKFHREMNLEQSRIDAAFQRPVRISNNIAVYKDQKICVLNGMYTGKLGVIDIEGLQSEKIRVTDVERTLIDITVRPVYSGGVFEVLKAYRLAKEKVSVNKLTAMLKRLNYVYPYHQAVGFYLERAGRYKDSSIGLLRKFGMKYDFYLTHQMKDTSYSKEWRLYFPKGL